MMGTHGQVVTVVSIHCNVLQQKKTCCWKPSNVHNDIGALSSVPYCKIDYTITSLQ